MIKYVLTVSDLHVGGTTALCPRNYTTLNDNLLGLSGLQEWLIDRWDAMVADALKHINGEPFLLVVNGDVIEGDHHRNIQIWSPDTNDHIEAARMLLAPLVAKSAMVAFVEGTECHTRGAEHILANDFGSKTLEDSDRGKGAWARLDINISGHRCVWHHHMPTTSRQWLRHNAIGAMLANEQLSAARSQEPVPFVLGMAHRHQADEISSSHGMAFVTPCWQMLTRYGYKVVPQAADSRIVVGGMLLDFSGSSPRMIPLNYKSTLPKRIDL